MDRADRTILALAATVVVFVAYGLCALVAYGLTPMVEGRFDDGGLALLTVGGLAGLLTCSVFRAVRTVRREVIAERELSRAIDAAAVTSSPRLRRAADEVGLSGRVRLLDSRSTSSFVHGALAPTVVLTTGLLARLSAGELEAALEHERYHVLKLDPLRGAFARVAADALFFLPVLPAVCRRYEASRELAADRRAIALSGPVPLAAALLEAIGGEAEPPATAVALAAPQAMESRLTQLETGREPEPTRLDPKSLGVSVFGALAFVALLLGLSVAVGGVANIAREFEPATLLEGGALCLSPLVLVSVLGYRRLSFRSVRSNQADRLGLDGP